jgi:hypothetical protein
MEEMMYKKLGLKTISNNSSEKYLHPLPNNSHLSKRIEKVVSEFKLPDAIGITEANNIYQK